MLIDGMSERWRRADQKPAVAAAARCDRGRAQSFSPFSLLAITALPSANLTVLIMCHHLLFHTLPHTNIQTSKQRSLVFSSAGSKLNWSKLWLVGLSLPDFSLVDKVAWVTGAGVVTAENTYRCIKDVTMDHSNLCRPRQIWIAVLTGGKSLWRYFWPTSKLFLCKTVFDRQNAYSGTQIQSRGSFFRSINSRMN